MIRVHGVSKSFGAARPALRNVSLRVEDGEFTALTGPGGSGKTTLFRLLVGELQPDCGSVVVAGRNLSRLDAAGIAELRREIGQVFEEPRLIAGLTLLDNVSLPAEVQGRDRATARRMAMEALGRVGLEAAAAERPGDLCGGDRQKASVARALCTRPALLLADEPTLGLDPDEAMEVLKVLTQACRDGATVLMATHDLEALSVVRGRVLVLHRGRLDDGSELLQDLHA